MKSINDSIVTYLDPEDPGYSAPDFQMSNRDQDDAFCAAMERAIKRGKEAPRRGIQTTSVEGVVLRPIRGETTVLGASSLAML